jgi:Putative peptidoglycan binding domain
VPRLSLAAIAICAALPLTPHARAEPARAALVLGDATYTTLPGLPGCAKSANTIAAATRALGFQVTDREDASTGGIDGGISEFSQHLANGGGTAFVYVCGYATDFNNRTFLLPTTANIARPSDVITQGLLAKSLLGAATHDPAAVAVVVFDLVAAPNGPPKLDLDALTGLPVPDGVGVIAVTEANPPDAPTPLASALVAGLAGPTVSTEALLANVRTQMAGNAASVVALHLPAHPGFLAGAPAPVVVKPPTPPAPGATPPTTAAPAASVSAATRPSRQVPDEAQMTDTDRRMVQTALVHLGYYDNPVDGVFGPETRAAIRRYQHEIGGEMTGRLTAEQATQLVNTP